jgi:hypothetical protein
MRQLPHLRRVLATVLAVTVFPTGCSTVHYASRAAAGDPERSAIDVRVFDREKDIAAGRLSARAMAGALETPDGHAVFRAGGPEWSLSDLEPGAYNVRIAVFKHGGESAPAAIERSILQPVTLHAGERLAVDVVAHRTTVGVVLGVAAGALLVGAIVAAVMLNASFKGWTTSVERRPTENLPEGVAARPVP